jgi:glutathione S-transferase
MSEFIVHSVPGSPFGRAVLTTLMEKGATVRFALVMPGTLKSEPHILRHPFGRIPVLEHEGFMLYETQAILRYLDRVIARPGLTPADPRAAGRMDQVLNISDWYLFREVNAVIGFHRIVAPQLLGLQPDEKAIAEALPKGRTTFRELSRLLGSQPYFAGNELSLADLLVAPHVDFLSATPEWQALTDEASNVVAWLQRMNARDSFKATTWERVTALAKAA